MDSLFGTHWQPLVFNSSPLLAPLWLHNWLRVSGSLTERLQAACQDHFCVKVLRHEFTPASPQACHTLDLAAETSLLQREVLLCDGDTPLVFASSLLPEISLQGRYSELRNLGARPLGHWIFQEPVLKRTAVYYSSIAASDELFALIPPSYVTAHSLWGRQTLFTGTVKPLLVSEFFLPNLARYPMPALL